MAELTDNEKYIEAEHRAFNMYYPANEGVQFDTELFTQHEYKRWGHLVGKSGIVLEAKSDVHVFTKGSVYAHRIDFQGEIVSGVFASYLKYSQEVLGILDTWCKPD